MDDRVALGVERPQAGHVVAPIAEFPIGRVFDQVDLPPHGPTLGQLDQCRAARRRHIHAAGIVVIGHRVNRLYPRQLAAAVQPSQLILDGLGDQAVLVDLHADGPHPQIAQSPHVDEIRRRPADHDIARVQKDIADEVQQLVAAGRDDDLLEGEIQLAGGARRRRGPCGPAPLDARGDGRSWCRIAAPPAPRRIGPEGLQGLAGGLDRQGFLIDETGGQGDQLGMGEAPGHQLADDGVAACPLGPPAQVSLVDHRFPD